MKMTQIGIISVSSMRLMGSTKRIGLWSKALICAGMMVIAPMTAQANSKYAGIVVDAKTGKTLYSSSADSPRYPASLTKIMTLYVVFEEMEAGRMTLDTRMKVSKYAAGRPPTKLGLKVGSTLKLKDAILGLVTKSANDASTVIAEHISGSEAAFARRMTSTAHRIGMSRTTFRNPHGLPNSAQRTTARDMSMLGRAIQERFPKYYKYFQTRSFTYRGRRMGNHNKLLGRVKGVDGIKTGYTRASGFNLVSSVQRDGRHIVAVVMGGRTGRSRDAQMIKLINKYLPRASKGRKTVAPLVASGPIRAFDAASLGTAPLPNGKPGVAKSAPAPTQVLALAEPQKKHSDPTQLLTGTVPVPSRAVANRVALTFEANGLPPVPQATPKRDTQPTASKPVIKMVETQTIRPATATMSVEPTKVASASPVVPVASVTTPAAPPAQKLAEEATKPVAASPAKAQAPAVEDTQEPGWQVQIAAAETESGAVEMLNHARSKTGKSLSGSVPYTEPVEANGKTLYRARFVGFETKTAALSACKTLKRAKFACYAIYQ